MLGNITETIVTYYLINGSELVWKPWDVDFLTLYQTIGKPPEQPHIKYADYYNDEKEMQYSLF